MEREGENKREEEGRGEEKMRGELQEETDKCVGVKDRKTEKGKKRN